MQDRVICNSFLLLLSSSSSSSSSERVQYSEYYLLHTQYSTTLFIGAC